MCRILSIMLGYPVRVGIMERVADVCRVASQFAESLDQLSSRHRLWGCPCLVPVWRRYYREVTIFDEAD